MHNHYKNVIFLATLALASQSFGQAIKPAAYQAPRSASVLKPCQEPVVVDPPTYLTLGKSRVIRLAASACTLTCQVRPKRLKSFT